MQIKNRTIRYIPFMYAVVLRHVLAKGSMRTQEFIRDAGLGAIPEIVDPQVYDRNALRNPFFRMRDAGVLYSYDISRRGTRPAVVFSIRDEHRPLVAKTLELLDKVEWFGTNIHENNILNTLEEFRRVYCGDKGHAVPAEMTTRWRWIRRAMQIADTEDIPKMYRRFKIVNSHWGSDHVYMLTASGIEMIDTWLEITELNKQFGLYGLDRTKN